MLYIGDLSRQDVDVLIKYSKDKDVLEFGVGASTQVFLQTPVRTLISLETEQKWIDITIQNIRELNILGAPDLRLWNNKESISGEFDIIFNDGVKDLRLEFAFWSWSLLKVGGYLICHDSRRDKDRDNVLEILKNFWYEIESITVSEQNSNVTIIKKCTPVIYKNWNIEENKESWMYTDYPKPENWKNKLTKNGRI